MMPDMLAALLLAALVHAPHDPVACWAISPAFVRDRTLYVCQPDFGLVLRSRDAGATFETVQSGLDTGYLSALVVSPDFANDGLLLAVDAGRLHRSDDSGTRICRPAPSVPRPAGVLQLAASRKVTR